MPQQRTRAVMLLAALVAAIVTEPAACSNELSALSDGEHAEAGRDLQQRQQHHPSCVLKLKHMSKCAGRELIHVFSKVEKQFVPLAERTPVKGNAGGFVIASVRNPCDYYSSLWAYSAHPKDAGGYASCQTECPPAESA